MTFLPLFSNSAHSFPDFGNSKLSGAVDDIKSNADKFQGKPTASGEAFDNNALTAAHRTFPFGTMLKVTNVKTGQSVVVKVNDRGPFHKDRMIDLSKSAAEKIGIVKAGVGEVIIEKVVVN